MDMAQDAPLIYGIELLLGKFRFISMRVLRLMAESCRKFFIDKDSNGGYFKDNIFGFFFFPRLWKNTAELRQHCIVLGFRRNYVSDRNICRKTARIILIFKIYNPKQFFTISCYEYQQKFLIILITY